MEYLESFRFATYDQEYAFRLDEKRTCFDSMYPFFTLSGRGLEELTTGALTILYGGNGSGKSTALNIMAEKLSLQRESPYNRSPFYEGYLKLCSYDLLEKVPACSRIITSDDVFDYMLHVRALNEGIDIRREEVFRDYLTDKYGQFRFTSMEDLDKLKRVNKARSRTLSKYTRERIAHNVREYSNGESGFRYFTDKIGEDGLYLLDEPENSLSPSRQMELSRFLLDSVRYCGCQIILATHSPYLLAMEGARIYDLNSNPAVIRSWTELPEVRAARDFFRVHEKDFKQD